MKQKASTAKWTLALLGMAWMLWLMLAGDFGRKKNEPAGANRENNSESHQTNFAVPAPVEKSTNEFQSFLDHSPTNGSLIFKNDSEQSQFPGDGNLWFRDARGHERFVATAVVSARFSPDGSKIAYTTDEDELFIETLQGEQLAHIPRAREPVWRSDSDAVSFSAVPSVDYPDLAQSVIYDLGSGQITQATNRN